MKKNLIFEAVSHFLYPSFCKNCNVLIRQDDVFCDACSEKIKPIVSFFLPLTKIKSIKVFAVSDYKDPLKNLILKKSFGQDLASRQLAQVMLEKINFKSLEIDYFVPVPLHWTRYAWRGYNQSYLMAKVLSKNLNIPCLNILKRTKRTIFQSSLKVEKRFDNVRDAFGIKVKYKILGTNFLENKNIFLVDDLCTTGSTLKSAAKILIKFNPKSINAVVACRVV